MRKNVPLSFFHHDHKQNVLPVEKAISNYFSSYLKNSLEHTDNLYLEPIASRAYILFSEFPKKRKGKEKRIIFNTYLVGAKTIQDAIEAAKLMCEGVINEVTPDSLYFFRKDLEIRRQDQNDEYEVRMRIGSCLKFEIKDLAISEDW